MSIFDREPKSRDDWERVAVAAMECMLLAAEGLSPEETALVARAAVRTQRALWIGDVEPPMAELATLRGKLEAATGRFLIAAAAAEGKKRPSHLSIVRAKSDDDGEGGDS